MAITFTTTTGSTEVTVHDVDHGAAVGDYVFFEDVSGLTGTSMNSLLDGKTFYVVSLIDADSYKIEIESAATGDNSSAGQASAYYYLETGIANAVLGPGWGAGSWGRSTWGSGVSSVAGEQIRLWSVDNFGQDLIACVYDGGLYYWTYYGSGTFPRLISLSNVFGNLTNEVPTIARFVATSDVDRHCLAFGVNPIGATLQDKLLIRWSDQENPTDWEPRADNTAGDLRLSQGTEIVAIIQTRKEILVFTDRSLHSLQFTGSPFTFGQSLIADNIRVSGPNALVSVNDVVYWMGRENFYRYDGRVQVLPCTVRNFVFSELNSPQSQKIYAATIIQQNEVWWFYPSGVSEENDRYVVFNYAENVWYTGNMSRTAAIDASSTVRRYPQATGSDGHLYDHEFGLDDGSTSPASPVNAYIESSDFDLGEGDRFMLTQRIIPDVTFTGSSASDPSVDFSVKVRNYPGQSYSEDVSGAVTRTNTTPVEQYTDQIFLRARGRSAAVRIESDELGVKWRVGAPRIDLRQDGRR
jgi:hypothetical protein